MNKTKNRPASAGRALATAAIALAASITGPSVMAQAYPNKPIRLIVPTAPGGGTDFMARVLAQKLTERIGATVVVENKGGAGGTIGSDYVAKAPADGYTLLLGYIGTHGTNPALEKLPYDAVKDFSPITQIAVAQTGLLINPSVKADSVQGLIALLKAEPGKLNYASSGKGSMPHIAGAMFEQLTGTDMTPIHYRGAAPALSDTVAGRTQLMFGTLVSGSAQIKSGGVKALAITGKTRSPLFPDVPTFTEAGLADFDVPQWYGVFAPAGTPPEVVAKLYASTLAALKDPDLQKRFAEQGSDVVTSSPEAFGKLVQSEIAKWTRVIKSAHITSE